MLSLKNCGKGPSATTELHDCNRINLAIAQPSQTSKNFKNHNFWTCQLLDLTRPKLRHYAWASERTFQISGSFLMPTWEAVVCSFRYAIAGISVTEHLADHRPTHRYASKKNIRNRKFYHLWKFKVLDFWVTSTCQMFMYTWGVYSQTFVYDPGHVCHLFVSGITLHVYLKASPLPLALSLWPCVSWLLI